MENTQRKFCDSSGPWEGMPSTRYQGSKRKLLEALYHVFVDLDFTWHSQLYR